MLTLPPKYKKHSVYKGHQIFKRLPGTGTSGGSWLADSTTFASLGQCKAYIDFYANLSPLPAAR